MNPHSPPRRVTMNRTFNATLEQVWALWTTRQGIESWWGPEGFSVTVQHLDLRPGGTLFYTMTATGAGQVAFMKQHGLPLSTESKITFTDVSPPARLAYLHAVDFVPGVPTYDTATVVELRAVEGGVSLSLSFDAMHDDTWTERATAGWTSELGKLDALLQGRAA